jgi:hypothetical protein
VINGQARSLGNADRDNVLMARSTDRTNYYYAGIASWADKNTTYRLTMVVRGLVIQLYDGGVLVASAVDTSLNPPVSYAELQTTTSVGQAAYDNISIDLPGELLPN